MSTLLAVLSVKAEEMRLTASPRIGLAAPTLRTVRNVQVCKERKHREQRPQVRSGMVDKQQQMPIRYTIC
jgi:hypothetical protein